MFRCQPLWARRALILVLSLGIVACQPIQPERLGRSENGAYKNVMNVDEAGNSEVNKEDLAAALAPVPVGELSAEETAGLHWMREEEKLAHDVYITLGEQWGLPIFQNISRSELTHTEAVKSLLERYGQDDPAANKELGVFQNTALQDLYNQLVEQGSQSLEDALIVGATIEDLDIVDLQTQIAQTDQADIQLVYENLMKGSRNHLRAFTKTLQTQTGQVYQPQYLDQAEYDAIVEASVERGGRGKR